MSSGRVAWLMLLTAAPLAVAACTSSTTASVQTTAPPVVSPEPTTAVVQPNAGSADDVLETLPVKGRAPMTGYSRREFGKAWTDANTAMWGGNDLDTRQDVLSRDLTDIACKVPPPKAAAPHCIVRTGVLHDPYTATTIDFTRGVTSSMAVQIDHVVALGDAWQTGAQQLAAAVRVNLANDPLELVAVDGPTNEQKGDADAASWLPPNKRFRCAYIARQIAVKARYRLWVTAAEKSAMQRVLSACPDQPLPTESDAAQRTY